MSDAVVLVGLVHRVRLKREKKEEKRRKKEEEQRQQREERGLCAFTSRASHQAYLQRPVNAHTPHFFQSR